MKFFRFIIFVFLIGFSSVKAQSRITNFYAVPSKDSVQLTFKILQGSTTCNPYEIRRGSDSSSLLPYYNYPAICGSTSFDVTYFYTDISPNKASPNFYQIFIPPNDYSQVLRVDVGITDNLLIYPQPVENSLTISIKDQKNYYYEITIYDRFGRKKGFGSGNVVDKINLDISGFAEGVYVFYIVQGGGNSYRGKFLKQPKN